MEETISLRELLQTLKKRFRLITAITLLAVLISGVVSYFFITPVYEASTQILVNQSKSEQGTVNYSDVQANLQIINTYNVIITSPVILDKVIDHLQLDMTAGQLNSKLSVGSERNSQVVKIGVQDTDPVRAMDIANTTAEVFKKEIVNIMKVDNVTILPRAEDTGGHAPIKPQPMLNIAIALVIGLMLGVGLTFLLEYLDNTIKQEQDIERMLGIPVLGVIGTIDSINTENQPKNRTSRSTRLRGETIGS